MMRRLVQYAAAAVLLLGVTTLAAGVRESDTHPARGSGTDIGPGDLRGEKSSADWVLSSARADGRVLEVAYFYGGCQDDLNEFTVSESETTVHIDVWIDDYDRPNGQACTLVLRMACHTIELDEPLGQRILTGDSDQYETEPFDPCDLPA